MRHHRYTTCAIALASALCMPAFAQGTNSPSGTAGDTTTTTRADTDRDFDYGWLGLLGLAGLVGLRKRPDVHNNDSTRSSMPR